MSELRVADASFRRFDVAATLIIFAAVVAIAYRLDRAYGRWMKENDLLAGPRARLGRMKSDYQDRRANATDVAQVIISVLDEVTRATSARSKDAR